MADRRKTRAKQRATRKKEVGAREFTVVLEEVRAQNRVFGEGQQLQHEQMQVLREQVQGLLEEAIADAQSKLAGRAVPRLSDHAIGAMAAIMGRRLRGMFED